MNNNQYSTKTPPDALRTLAQIRVLTSHGWHLQVGSMLLLSFEWLFYLISAIWLAGAALLNENMLEGILSDIQDAGLQTHNSMPGMGITISLVLKLMMAILGMFSLAVGLLLRKWHRKNKVLARVHGLTENFIAEE